MPVPFDQLAWQACMMPEAVDDARNTPWKSHSGKRYSIAQRVTCPDLYRHAAFLAKLAQFQRKRNDKSVEVRAGYVLKMAARPDANFDCRPYDAQIVLQGLLPCHVEFFEDMIVGAADKNPALFNSHILCQLEIAPGRPDPARHLRILVSQFLALVYRFLVPVAVQEKLALADDALGPAEPVQHLVKRYYLFDGIGFPRLLPVPESGVCDPDLVCREHRYPSVVERAFRYFVIIVYFPVKVRIRDILQFVSVQRLFKRIRLLVKYQHNNTRLLFLVLHYCIQLYNRCQY